MFHLRGKVKRHNVRIWGMENPHATNELVRFFPKVNVFLPFQLAKSTGHFYLRANCYRYQLSGHPATLANTTFTGR